MQVISTITCDLTRKGAPAIVHAMQNDANTRYVRIRMTDNGVPWTAPEGAYAYVAVGKSDGKKAFYRYMADEVTEAVTFEGNEATLVLLPEALTAAGQASATINIFTAADEKISPLYFILDVQRAPVTDEDMVSTDYYQLPMQAVQTATDRANAAAEYAESVTGFRPIDYFSTLDDLYEHVPNPRPGDAYGIGESEPYDIYVYGETAGWVNNGPISGAEGPQGPAGPQGEKGEKGDTGDPGPKGDAGPQGEKGEKGDTGDTGPAGPTGPQGEKGDTGPEGPQGPQGERGVKGDTGATGATGPQGPKGETGSGFAVLDYYDTLGALQAAIPDPAPGDAYGVGTAEPYDIYIYGETAGWVNNGPLQGAKGDPGPAGPQGEKGEKGDTGETGPQGPIGPQGEPGMDGAQGPQGDTGPKGDTGATGPQGPQGEPGPAGADGAQGPKGETGPAGADGYTPQRGVDYWTEADQQIIVEAVLAALPAAEGVTF